MILNEKRIIERIIEKDPHKKIVVTPIIDSGHQFGPSSLDLRLGTEFKIIKNSRQTHIDPLDESDVVYAEPVHIKPLEPFVLHPGQFVLGCTLEYLKLPEDIAGRLEGRSTWGRLGLQIHSTAGFVDPGFCGNLTFELNNVGNVPISLYAGVRIAQISFYESEDTEIPYDKKKITKYGSKTGTVESKYLNDPEFKILRKMKNKKTQ